MGRKSYKDWHTDPTWEQNRRNGLVQIGTCRCDFVKIFLPDRLGQVKTVWSFPKDLRYFGKDGVYNNELTKRSPQLIIDYPLAELDYFNGNINPLLRITRKWFCAEEDFYLTKSLHTGILTDAAIDYIEDMVYKNADYSNPREKEENLITQLLSTDCVILYNPRALRWESTGENFLDTVETTITKTSTNKNNKTKAIIAAALATII